VSEAPPPKGLLTPLEEQFRKSGYDIADVTKTMLASRVFFSEHAYRKRVKWPVEFALGAVNTAEPGRVPLFDLVDPLAKMGQALFAPPNVKGWRTGTDWLNSATLLARNNFAETVALGTWRKAGRPPRNNSFAFETTAVKPEGPRTADNMPPLPDSKHDVCELVYAAKPKDVSAVVKRLSEMLYGDAVPADVSKKIETFLLTPGPAPGPKPVTPKGPKGPPAPVEPPATVEDPDLPAQPGTSSPPKPKGKDEPKKDPPKPLNPKDVKVDSPEFKARVREAAHAMMCLPEYQLN
jgi:hypothetical protein